MKIHNVMITMALLLLVTSAQAQETPWAVEICKVKIPNEKLPKISIYFEKNHSSNLAHENINKIYTEIRQSNGVLFSEGLLYDIKSPFSKIPKDIEPNVFGLESHLSLSFGNLIRDVRFLQYGLGTLEEIDQLLAVLEEKKEILSNPQALNQALKAEVQSNTVQYPFLNQASSWLYDGDNGLTTYIQSYISKYQKNRLRLIQFILNLFDTLNKKKAYYNYFATYYDQFLDSEENPLRGNDSNNQDLINFVNKPTQALALQLYAKVTQAQDRGLHNDLILLSEFYKAFIVFYAKSSEELEEDTFELTVQPDDYGSRIDTYVNKILPQYNHTLVNTYSNELSVQWRDAVMAPRFVDLYCERLQRVQNDPQELKKIVYVRFGDGHRPGILDYLNDIFKRDMFSFTVID